MALKVIRRVILLDSEVKNADREFVLKQIQY